MKTPKFFSTLYRSVFVNPKSSWFWLLVRVYLGWQWLEAGYEKVINPAWSGGSAGGALTGFINGALAKTVGAHPDVSIPYAWFLKSFVLTHVVAWSNLVAYGELLVGVGLILGALTFLSAFFGMFMNLNYLLAGTVSVNPQMLILSLLIMLAKKTSGIIGLDYYIERKNSK